MKNLLLVCLILAFASCKKPSTYMSTCDIYKIKHFTYNPNSPLSKTETYSGVTKGEAEDSRNLFEIKYTAEVKDTFAKLKAIYPDAFISCGLKDINDY